MLLTQLAQADYRDGLAQRCIAQAPTLAWQGPTCLAPELECLQQQNAKLQQQVEALQQRVGSLLQELPPGATAANVAPAPLQELADLASQLASVVSELPAAFGPVHDTPAQQALQGSHAPVLNPGHGVSASVQQAGKGGCAPVRVGVGLGDEGARGMSLQQPRQLGGEGVAPHNANTDLDGGDGRRLMTRHSVGSEAESRAALAGVVDTGWRLRQGLLSLWHHQRLQLKAGSPALPDQPLHEKHRGQEASRKRALAP